MSLTDGDLVVLAPLLAAHLSANLASPQGSGAKGAGMGSTAKVFIDVSAEENFISDPGVFALCGALELVVRAFKGRVLVRSLNVAFNGVSDAGCFAIGKLVQLHIELNGGAVVGGGGGDGKKKKGDNGKDDGNDMTCPMLLRLAWNHVTASGAAALLNAYPCIKSASMGGGRGGGGGGGETGGGLAKKPGDKRLSARARCLLGYNFVNSDLLRPMVAGVGGAAGDADVPSLDVELGGVVIGGAGSAGTSFPVQFSTPADAQKVFWEHAMSKHSSGAVGGVSGEGRVWPVLLVLSAESLVRLAQHAPSNGGTKGVGSTKGGGGGLAELITRVSGKGRGGGDKGIALGPGGAVRFVVLGCVYRSLRYLQDSSAQDDQRAINALLATSLPKAVDSGCLWFVDGTPLTDIDAGMGDLMNGANGSGTPNGNGKVTGGGRSNARAGGGKTSRPLSSWKAALTREALLSCAAQLHKSCRHVVAQNRAECSWKTDPVVLVLEDAEAVVAAKAVGVPAVRSEWLMQHIAGKGLGKLCRKTWVRARDDVKWMYVAVQCCCWI